MRIRYTRRAAADLEAIADYLTARNPPAALKVRDAILESLRHLALFPGIGRRQSVEGVRKLNVRRYPYLIFYMVDEAADELTILTFRHAAREQDYWDL